MPLQANIHDLKQLNKPFYIFKPKKLKKNVEAFIKKFNGEAIYSVSRGGLNVLLMNLAEREKNIDLYFNHKLINVT